MSKDFSENKNEYQSTREKFLGLSLESTRKSYYPQLQANLEIVKENERRLKLLTDNLPARISYVDANECYVFVNREYEKAFGLKRDQIVGQKLKSVISTSNYNKVKKYIQQTLSGKQVRFEESFSEKNGESKWFEVNYVPDMNSQGVIIGFYDLTRDITDQRKSQEETKRLENKLQQAQKMEAIGTLAGGIAHDFNNLLMGIQGRASLILIDLEPDHPYKEHLKGIEEYIQSASKLTRQLLGFARGGKYDVKPINLNELIENSSTMFGRTKKEIKIFKKFQQTIPAVEADRSQIEQVFINIYVNAWQAMPNGGSLYVETKGVTLEDDYCTAHQVQKGQYVKVSITDTGIGMDKKTCQRIFDPFFTTKDKSRGTGLGLASAYGIIKNHGGIISVYSEINHGTTFNIYFPASSKEIGYEIKADDELRKGSETILLVDDEKLIINVGRALLERLGYDVVIAKNGKEAVDLVRKMGNEIDLIILDLIMPEMDGGQTFDRIREINSDIGVLLSSGYSINGKAAEVMEKGCQSFIQKPFNIAELSRKIRKILDN